MSSQRLCTGQVERTDQREEQVFTLREAIIAHDIQKVVLKCCGERFTSMKDTFSSKIAHWNQSHSGYRSII